MGNEPGRMAQRVLLHPVSAVTPVLCAEGGGGREGWEKAEGSGEGEGERQRRRRGGRGGREEAGGRTEGGEAAT